jgi:fructose-bisphosphate aldolase class I
MEEQYLESTTKALVAPEKGVLAADWSLHSTEKHFGKYGIEHTEKMRRFYRQMLFTTPGIEKYISGVIFYDETIRQKTDDGVPFPQYLSDRGIIPGIKVDKGTVELANFPGELITEGLDGLRERLVEYKDLGARFAKWRAVISIDEGQPTRTALEANAHDLARYAAICQETGIVPIVEPEVLLEGDYDIARCKEVTEAGLKMMFHWLIEHRVVLEGCVLKPNMVQPGKSYERKASPEEVAVATVDAFNEVVPKTLPGIAFLSGGQSPEDATANLNAINKLGEQPWQLTFSFARALQQPVLEVWRGDKEKIKEAQDVFVKRAKLNSLARQGKYQPNMENE